MKNYSREEKEIVLRPIIWLIFHAIALIFWIIIGISTNLILKLFIASVLLRWSAAIILATVIIFVLFKIIDFYFRDKNLDN